eukprot:Clim_evm94s156 gene=Clim_evmTU94s156
MGPAIRYKFLLPVVLAAGMALLYIISFSNLTDVSLDSDGIPIAELPRGSEQRYWAEQETIRAHEILHCPALGEIDFGGPSATMCLGVCPKVRENPDEYMDEVGEKVAKAHRLVCDEDCSNRNLRTKDVLSFSLSTQPDRIEVPRGRLPLFMPNGKEQKLYILTTVDDRLVSEKVKGKFQPPINFGGADFDVKVGTGDQDPSILVPRTQDYGNGTYAIVGLQELRNHALILSGESDEIPLEWHMDVHLVGLTCGWRSHCDAEQPLRMVWDQVAGLPVVLTGRNAREHESPDRDRQLSINSAVGLTMHPRTGSWAGTQQGLWSRRSAAAGTLRWISTNFAGAEPIAPAPLLTKFNDLAPDDGYGSQEDVVVAWLGDSIDRQLFTRLLRTILEHPDSGNEETTTNDVPEWLVVTGCQVTQSIWYDTGQDWEDDIDMGRTLMGDDQGSSMGFIMQCREKKITNYYFLFLNYTGKRHYAGGPEPYLELYRDDFHRLLKALTSKGYAHAPVSEQTVTNVSKTNLPIHHLIVALGLHMTDRNDLLDSYGPMVRHLLRITESWPKTQLIVRNVASTQFRGLTDVDGTPWRCRSPQRIRAQNHLLSAMLLRRSLDVLSEFTERKNTQRVSSRSGPAISLWDVFTVTAPRDDATIDNRHYLVKAEVYTACVRHLWHLLFRRLPAEGQS